MTRILATLTTLYSLLSIASAAPNILFICVDDLKPNLHCYGDPIAITPNIDRLAKSGITFTNAHAAQAVCGPSRCSTFSSLTPDRTKVHDLKTNFLAMVPWVTTLPEHFRKHGYATAGCGKLFHGGKGDAVLEKRAFNIYTHTDDLPYNKAYPAPALYYQSKTAHAVVNKLKVKRRRKIINALKAAHAFKSTECLDLPDDAYADGAIRIQTLRNIDTLTKANKPFFIAAGFKKPHLPFTAPKKYWDLYKRNQFTLAPYRKKPVGAPNYALSSWGELKSYSDIEIPVKSLKNLPPDQQKQLIHGYYASISYADAQIGYLLDDLKKRDLLKNTIIILWGDHGWHLGDHGIWCKHTNFEQATRTTLIVAGPGILSGKKNNSPTQLIDIFPTLCDLANIPMAKNRDGTSFKPILTGEKQAIHEVAISSYPRWGGKLIGYSLRGPRFRYTAWLNTTDLKHPHTHLTDINAEEFYDYQTDPNETKNHIKDPELAAKIKHFRQLLDQHLKAQAKRIGGVASSK